MSHRCRVWLCQPFLLLQIVRYEYKILLLSSHHTLFLFIQPPALPSPLQSSSYPSSTLLVTSQARHIKMRTSTFLLAAASAYTATALPLASTTDSSSSLPTGTSSKTYDWSASYISDFTIHSSCNATERNQLEFALEETVELAKHAKEHSKTLINHD